MPQIFVVTDSSEDGARTVVYRERIAPSDLESDHFSGQLVERVGWDSAMPISSNTRRRGRAQAPPRPPHPPPTCSSIAWIWLWP